MRCLMFLVMVCLVLQPSLGWSLVPLASPRFDVAQGAGMRLDTIVSPRQPGRGGITRRNPAHRRGICLGMAERTIIVGDVHGCREEVEALLRLTRYKPEVDRLVFVGDLVAKGPDSLGVLRLLSSLGATSVSGNHEQKLLRCARQSRALFPPIELLDSEHWGIMKELRTKPHVWKYVKEMPLYLHLPDYDSVVVHAGMLPGKRPEHMSAFDLTMIRTVMETGEASPRKDAGKPWTELWDGPERVIFGHDAEKGLQVGKGFIGLDTGCVYGGKLSALVLPGKSGNGDVMSVPAHRNYAAIVKRPAPSRNRPRSS